MPSFKRTKEDSIKAWRIEITLQGEYRMLRNLLPFGPKYGNMNPRHPISLGWIKLCRNFDQKFFLYIYIQSKDLRYKLLNTLLKLLYNTTTMIPRGAKYYDNPEALKKEKLKRKTFKRKPDITIKKDMDKKKEKGVAKKECLAAWFVAEFGKSLI